jgi:hypothetical protein
MPKKLLTNTVGRRLTHSSPELTAKLFDFEVAVTAESRRLSREVVIGVDCGKCDKPGDACPPRRCHHRLQFIAERSRIQEHRRSTIESGDGRTDGAYPGGKRRGIRTAGHRTDLHSGIDKLRDEGTADVAGGPGDENCVHVRKDGAESGKVTRCGRNFSSSRFVFES